MTDSPKSQTSGAFTERVDLWDTVLRRFRTAEHLEHDQKTEGLLKSLARLGAMVAAGYTSSSKAVRELKAQIYATEAERIRKEYGGE